MSYSQRIQQIEAAAIKRKVKLSAFFGAAKIAHTTWSRWKSGDTTPNFSTWERVEKAAEDLGLNDRSKAA